MGEDLFERWLRETNGDVNHLVTFFGVSSLLEEFDEWLWDSGYLVKKETAEEFLRDCTDGYINDTVLLLGVHGLLGSFEVWLTRVGYLRSTWFRESE